MIARRFLEWMEDGICRIVFGKVPTMSVVIEVTNDYVIIGDADKKTMRLMHEQLLNELNGAVAVTDERELPAEYNPDGKDDS